LGTLEIGIATVLDQIGPEFERATGHKLNVVSGFDPIFLRQINAGGVLHTAANHAIEMALDPLVVIVMTLPRGLSVVAVMAFLLSWMRLVTSSSARFGAASP
jgi:hypothetical protein